MPSIATLKRAETDPKLKEDGVEIEIRVAGLTDSLKLTMRSTSSNKARAWDLARFRKQRSYYLNDGIPPIAVIDQNEIDKLAEVLVLGWNVTDEEGQAVPCTVENVRAAMTQLADVRRDALVEAAKQEHYRLATVEGLAKNSETPSRLSSATGAEEA